MRVIKSRFVAYRFYKDGKSTPGLLTVIAGHLIPEFDKFRNPYLAARPWSGFPDSQLQLYPPHTKEEVASWKEYLEADRVQRIIVESEYVSY